MAAARVISGSLGGLVPIYNISCKPLISVIGMCATLALGNLLLAVGMLGLALERHQVPHFLLFACHIEATL